MTSRIFVMLRNEASVCDRFCIAAFAQKADPSFVGMTKDAGMTKSRGDDKPVFCHAEERSICMRSFLRCGTCAEYGSLLRRDDKGRRDDKVTWG